MTTEQWFEKAADYFSQTMPREEAQLFETETAASEELSQLMQLWKDTDEEAAVYEQNREGARAFIATHQKLKADFFHERQPGEFLPDTKKITAGKLKFSVWKWLAMAAAITGIVFMIKMLSPSSQKDSPVARHKINADSANKNLTHDSGIVLSEENKPGEKSPAQTAKDSTEAATLYAQAFAPDEVPENPNGVLDNAFFYYQSAQYKKAINAIDSAGSKAATRGNDTFTPLTNFYAIYYKALSMMSLGDTRGAIPLLKQSVVQSPAETLKAKAQWYLALAYIKQNRILAASDTLELLINNPSAGQYKSTAEKLLMALKQ